MTTDEIQALLNDANCYGCLGLSMTEMLTLALERQWLLTLQPNADTSVAALTAAGSCFACYDMSMFDLLENTLLSLIAGY